MATVMALSMVSAVLVAPASAGPAGAVTLSQTLVVNGAQTTSATVAAGTQVTLSLGYNCTGAPCADASITVPFPAGLAVGTPQLTQDVASYAVSGNTLTLTMVNPLAAGTAGQVTVPVAVPAYTTPDGTVFPWQSTMSATATTSTTTTVALTASAGNSPSVTTSLQSGGTLDQPSTYSIQACEGAPAAGAGPLEISAGSTLVSTLPAGATFESADSGGSWASGGAAGTVSWTLGAVQGCATVTYTVEYLSSDGSNTVGASKVVSASWSGRSPGDTADQALGQDSTTTVLVAPTVTGQFSDWSFTGSLPVTEGMTYFITAHNTGNTTWDNLTTTDQIDPKMQVTNIDVDNVTTSAAQLWVASRLGGGTLVLAATVAAGASLNFNPYAAWPAGPAALAAGDLVQSFQVVEAGVVPNANFTVAGVNATALAADLNGNPTNVGDTLTNVATFSYTAGSTTPPTVTEDCDVTVAAQIPTLTTRDSGPGVLAQGVRTGTFDLTASSGNFPTPNPVLAHLIAPTLSMTSWSMQQSGSLPTPTMTEIDNFDNSGWTLFRWTFPAGTVLPTNGWVGITIDVSLGAHSWGTLTDKGYTSSTSMTPYCDSNYFGSSADVNNILGDDQPTKVPCEWDASISPAPSTVANVTTSAEGRFTTTMVTGPGTAYTAPGNADTLGVSFNNDGTIPLTQVSLIDVLPKPGDSDILSSAQRDPTTDTFPVELAGTPTVPSLSTSPVVSYSTATDPCEPDLSYSPGGCAAPAWTTTRPANLATVTAVKVAFGSDVIDPYTSWTVDVPVTTPATGSTPTDHAAFNPDPLAPQNDQIAYDTAAFIATSTASNATLLPAESSPVALRVPSELGPEGAAPSPAALTSTGAGTAAQSATATVPQLGSATLLNGSGSPVSSLTVPDVGSYSIDTTTGAITFTPDLGYTGSPPAVAYRITNGFDQTGQSTYTPTVTAPALAAPPALTTSGVGPAVQTVTATVPPSGSVTLLDGSGNPVGTLAVAHVGTYAINTGTGTITFTPDLGYTGTPPAVSYRITDAYGTTRTSTYTPTVTAPELAAPPALTTSGVGPAVQTVTATVPPSGSVTLLDGSGNPVGTLAVANVGTYAINTGTGTITFTPDLGYTGTPTPVSYRITDAYGTTRTSTYTPTVTVPAPPSAPTETSTASGTATQAATAPVPPGGSIVLVAPDGATADSVTIPKEGTYTLDATTGRVTFAPLAGFTGTPTPVSYRVTDAYGGSATGQYVPGQVGAGAVPVLTGGAVAATPGGAGYWSLSLTGTLSAHGNAADLGSENRHHVPAPLVGVISTTDGHGYWLVGASGLVYHFGDARGFGDLAGVHLASPIVEMARTPDNGGYWLVAADGRVFRFGDARYYGSLGAAGKGQPVVAMTATPDGRGYWLAASDGRVFRFGDARFYGSMGGTELDKDVNGIVSTPDGHGYWLIALDGGVFTFGDAGFYGSLADGTHLYRGILTPGVTPINGIIIGAGAAGYHLTTPAGVAYAFGGRRHDRPVVVDRPRLLG